MGSKQNTTTLVALFIMLIVSGAAAGEKAKSKEECEAEKFETCVDGISWGTKLSPQDMELLATKHPRPGTLEWLRVPPNAQFLLREIGALEARANAGKEELERLGFHFHLRSSSERSKEYSIYFGGALVGAAVSSELPDEADRTFFLAKAKERFGKTSYKDLSAKYAHDDPDGEILAGECPNFFTENTFQQKIRGVHAWDVSTGKTTKSVSFRTTCYMTIDRGTQTFHFTDLLDSVYFNKAALDAAIKAVSQEQRRLATEGKKTEGGRLSKESSDVKF